MVDPLALTIVAAGQVFFCTPVAVWDGDGPIWCAEGPKVRLAGIAAREIDGTCKPGHPCPKPDGKAARDHLVKVLGGPKGTLRTGHVRVQAPALRCLSDGSGKGGRTAAWCSSRATGDLSCRMVQAGYANVWKSYGGERVCLTGGKHSLGATPLQPNSTE